MDCLCFYEELVVLFTAFYFVVTLVYNSVFYFKGLKCLREYNFWRKFRHWWWLLRAYQKWVLHWTWTYTLYWWRWFKSDTGNKKLHKIVHTTHEIVFGASVCPGDHILAYIIQKGNVTDHDNQSYLLCLQKLL